ncbi:Na/Pi cotransporter family protein [Devosia lucknowensis]|uniref:Na/Pi cotransporter family protein n=1 Tax=Devosia lucknowensis TaxID=1096929 RepID=UPI000A3C154B|nr:Na/Pi cotransporter family protein [Devosia lucknowensis]
MAGALHLASLLLMATLADQGKLPVVLAVSLVLGANLGDGLFALGITLIGVVHALRIAIGSCLFRGLGAVIGLIIVKLHYPPLTVLTRDPAYFVINMHLAFNLALVVPCLPLTSLAARLLTAWIRPRAMPDPLSSAPTSCLDQSVVDRPVLALGSGKRELLRIAETVERVVDKTQRTSSSISRRSGIRTCWTRISAGHSTSPLSPSISSIPGPRS